MVSAPWRRDFAPSRPVLAYPPPKPEDPGRRPSPVAARPVRTPAGHVTWTPPPAPPAPARPAAPAAWQPAPRGQLQVAPCGPRRLVLDYAGPPRPLRVLTRPAGRYDFTAAPAPDRDGINYDPPPESAGTGLQQTNPDGSWVVHPLSVIHPGSAVGDEGPINEAFESTPVVHLCAGRAYALASRVVVPDNADLYLNRAVIDRDMITAGDGAVIHD